MSNFININYVNYHEHINKGLVLIDFWAEWCTACIAQDKYFVRLQELFGYKLKICKLNVADNRILSDEFKVRNIPFIILMQDGKEILRLPGVQDENYLVGKIKEYL